MSNLDPEDWSGFRRQAHRMLDDILDYVEHIRERPVWRPIPDSVRQQFRTALPSGPSDLAEVHDEFLRYVMPFAAGNVHPGFMGWVHGAGTPVGIVAEMLAAGLNANVGGRDHIPVEVERQVIEWMRSLFGFPETTGGLFVTGASMANLLGILVARDAALGFETRAVGVQDARLTAYSSKAAHGCIEKALDVAGLGTNSLRRVDVDGRYRTDLNALRDQIAADRKAGFSPFLLVGTAGTVDTGAIDDLDALATIAAEEKLWFHVDGAFGALVMLSPELAPRLKGIERADSLAFDFHKWMHVPYDAGFVLVRDGTLHRQAFATSAAYLRRETRGLAAGLPWLCDFGPDLSRGFRALKTWFTLKTYGTDALGAAISKTCELASYLKELILDIPELELAAPVELNIVCFRYRAAESDRVNAAIAVELQESGVAAPSTTILDGKIALRAALLNHRTERADLDALIDRTLALGARQLMKLGHTAEARDAYIRVLSRMPSDRVVLNELGRLLQITGFRTAARTTFGQAVKHHPGDATSEVNLANALYEDGDFDAARQHYEAALQASPENIEAHRGLSYALAEAGDFARAELHRRKGFESSSVETLPYRGDAEPVRVLLLISAVGGNVRMLQFLDDKVFETTAVAVEYYPLDKPLPPHDLVCNAIGDADVAGEGLLRAQSILAQTHAPVLNAPTAVQVTGRTENARRLRQLAGVVTPVSVTLPRASITPEVLASHGLPFPLLLRSPGFHTGRHFVRADESGMLDEKVAELPGDELIAMEYLDARGADGKVRKYRVMLIDGEIYPLHVAISSDWKIHYFTAEMADSAAHRAEDAEFLSNMSRVLGHRAMAALREIQRALGLEYAGVDFGLSKDGEVLLFEANATMVVNPPEPTEKWAYRRSAVEGIYAAVRKMLLARVRR